MIVTCGQCDTQFRLDDSKLGARGLRVRCSLCKHSFFVAPPAASRGERVEQLAREALESGPLAPEPTDDLAHESPDPDEETAPDLGRPARAPGGPGAGLDDDGDWKFNEENAPEDATHPIGISREEHSGLELAGDPPEPAAAEGEGRLARPEPPAAGREELGSPESWDLLGASAEAPRASRGPLASQGAAAGASGAVAARLAVADLGASLRQAAAALADAEVGSAWPRLAHAAAALGWLALVGLFAAGLAGGVAPGSSAPARTGIQKVAGLEAHVASARYVENAIAGSLYVVSGELRNAGAGEARPGDPLGVRLVDARGRDLAGAAAPLGPPLTERELREWEPGRLARQQAAGALRLAEVPLRPGQRWLFDAVLTEVPAAAAGFRFELASATAAAPASESTAPGSSLP